MLLKIIFIFFFGIAGGIFTAIGFFAIISTIPIIPRIAIVSNTTQKMRYYEDLIIIGLLIGNILSLFSVNFLVLDYSFRKVLMIIYGLFSGMFVGTFVVSMAEVFKTIPILSKRMKMGENFGIIIIMVALGKSIGHIIYYMFLYG